MVLDTLRQRLVMPLGVVQDGEQSGSARVHNNTYEWSGSGWRGVNPIGPKPTPRGAYGLAFDDARGVTVLFGGSDFQSRFGDTWTWDGQRWTLMASTGPSARDGVAMAYDAARQRVVLFGGTSSTGRMGDTWLWDGQTWNIAPGGGLPTRSYSAMAYDPIRQRAVLFGGRDTASRNETYEWNGVSWSFIPTTNNPPARWGANMVWDPLSQRILMFGGADVVSGTPTSDTRIWSFDGVNWTPRTMSVGFRQRYVGAAGFDPISQQVLLFGGLSGAITTDSTTWGLQHTNWVAIAPGAITWNLLGEMVFDSLRQQVLMMSSRVSAWRPQGWTDLGPCPSTSSSSAYDSHRDRVVLLSAAGETWEFDGTSWTNRLVQGPPPRSGAIMGYDAVRRVTIAHGGSTNNTPLSDTWEWNGEVWNRVSTAGPARMVAAGAFDAARGMLVVFSGLTSTSSISGDTWGWNGSEWTMLANTGPSPRYGHAMAYDPSGERILLFGVFGTTSAEDLWEWNGIEWRQLVATGPGSRRGCSLGFDSVRGELVLFGGYSNTTAFLIHQDTWTLRTDQLARVRADTQRVQLCRGDTLTLTAQAEPGRPVTYQWRRWDCSGPSCIEPGLTDGPTSSGAVISGSAGPVLTISNVGPRDQTNYRCLITADCNSALTQQVFVGVCAPDFDCSGAVSLQDLFSFLAAWFAQAPAADFNGSDDVTVQDIFDFLSSYFVGCA